MRQQRPTAAPLVPGVWDIDPGHSSIEFVARHLFWGVRGRFSEFGGTIEVGIDPTQSSAVVLIEAHSIDTKHKERDDHLRSPDVLDVDRFPTLAFRSTAVRLFDGERALCLDGELTVRDTTKPVSFDVEYLGCRDDPHGATRGSFSARTGIDRDHFGVTWDPVLDSGGLLIGKRVLLEIDIEALLTQP
jgi:polyisoprenoid-binding protein YceI